MTAIEDSDSDGDDQTVRKAYGKAPKFSGNEKDWSDWSWRYRSWAAITRVSSLLDKSLEFTGSLKLADCSSKIQKKPRTVYHTFVNCLEGRALQLLKSIEPGNGFVAWKKLNEYYAPATAGRFMSVLSGLMAVQFRNPETFVQELETWEWLVSKYETDSGETLSETVKAAVLLKGLTHKLQEVVRMSGTSVGDYSAMTTLLTKYVRAGQRFDVHGSLVSSGSRGSHDDPMDIGFVKGKGKGKGKSSQGKRSGSKEIGRASCRERVSSPV